MSGRWRERRPGARSARAARAVLALAALGLGACGANHAGRGDDGADHGVASADSVRGVVAVTGAEPVTSVVVRPSDGGAVVLTGPGADSLRAAAGLEVRVSGPRDAEGRMVVESFRVRSASGVPAADGRLELDGDTAVLVTATGERLRYPHAPAALRGLVGRRVWIGGEPGSAPQQWGALEP